MSDDKEQTGMPHQHMLSQDSIVVGEPMFQTLVESLPDAILVHVKNRIAFVNPVCVKLLAAQTAGQLLGKEVSGFIHPDFLPEVSKRIQQCYSTGMANLPMDVTMIACDGSPVEIEAIAIPILWNRSPAIEVVLRDIRDRKRAEQSAQAWQKRLELAQIAGLRIGWWDWDITSHTVEWSDETYRQFGFTPETFSSRVEDALERIHPEDRLRVENAIQEVFAGAAEYAAQYRLVRPDGTVCWIDAHGVVVREGPPHMIGIGVDITELKNAEQSLKESEERHRKLFENATYGIYVSKPDGTLLDANPALIGMLGYGSKEEFLALNLNSDVYAEPGERAAILAKYGSGGRVDGAQAKWKRKDGSLISVRVSGGAVRRPDMSIDHFEVIVEDITERQILEEQFRQAQKMEAVGRLAGGVAHDFNNLLMIINTYSQMLGERLADDEKLRRMADQVLSAGRRAASLTQQLLAFSRRQVLVPMVLDLNAVLIDLAKMLPRLIGEDIDLQMVLGENLGKVKADASQVQQVVLNLAVNSRDAMPKGGQLIIRTANGVLEKVETPLHRIVVAGPYVMLSVSDTGTGIDSETQARIFEPFFTTKGVDKGTGLGLSIVFGVVKQSGGYVFVESRLMQGTTFKIYLPRIDQATAPQAVEPEGLRRGTETILLVEDAEAVREAVCDFLEDLGYKVLSAANPAHALALLSEQDQPVHLLLTDVVMPGMNGRELASRLRASHKDMQVLYMSGYSDRGSAGNEPMDLGADFLQKPFSLNRLAAKLREVLGRVR